MIRVFSATIAILFILTGCKDSVISEQKYYVESQPSFFELRNGNWLTNKWIRKPENLLSIHETFKRIGYNNLIGQLLSENPLVINSIYINKKGFNLIDSLILTYRQREIGTKYFNEFWARREKEQNDSVVFLILNEIQQSYTGETKLDSYKQRNADSKPNDTLKALLEIEFRKDSLTDQLASIDFEALKRLGFHQSAYNLLYERYKYQDLRWNRDSLATTLTQSNKSIDAWFEDDTK